MENYPKEQHEILAEKEIREEKILEEHPEEKIEDVQKRVQKTLTSWNNLNPKK